MVASAPLDPEEIMSLVMNRDGACLFVCVQVMVCVSVCLCVSCGRGFLFACVFKSIFRLM